MSWTFVACVGIAFAWLGLFYLWGRGFLEFIKAEQDSASSICFGYLVLQVLYQIIYLPFYLNRGSYRITVYLWLGIVFIGSALLTIFIKNKLYVREYKASRMERVGICGAVILVLGLAFFISLHVPFYGQDTRVYISAMNESHYRDTMWMSTKNTFHYGMSSMFQFFTIPALLTGIKPYYISLFSVRIVGVCLFSLAVYRMGTVVFTKSSWQFSWAALSLSVVASYLLMFWGSNYTAEFFYWRIYEAKGYCQFVLFPIGFSVFLEMLTCVSKRKECWKEQLLVGLAAVPISASSLTPYLFFLLMGILAVLAYDKFRKCWKTIGRGILCALPNIVYLAVYILTKKGLIVI